MPPEYSGIAGRTLHFRDSDGNTGTARVEGVGEPDECLPVIVVQEPLPVSLDGFFLASTAPVRVAPAENIPRTDARLADGIAHFLRNHGVLAPRVEIVRALAADLDGDGNVETVVEAITPGRDIGEMSVFGPGDFSIVAIGSLGATGYVVADDIGYIYDGQRTPSRFGIVTLPDFTGAGQFDIAIWYSGWEWAGIDVYAWRNGSARFLASAFCGV